MKQRLFFTFFLLLTNLMASAYDCQVDGIYYNLDSSSKTATVTYQSPSNGGYSGRVNIPSSVSYDGTSYSVTSIGGSAFSYCYGLTSITIPNSVTSIGSNAFYSCNGLTSITIPNSVTSIGGSAFSYCSCLTSVNITDLAAWCGIIFGSNEANPLYKAHHLYLNGEEVKDLIIPNSVTSIGNGAFYGCSGLTSVTIPNSVTSIGSHAFSLCYGLTSITIPNSVTSIGDYAFSNCGLTSVTIPNSVTSIGDYAFNGCI